MRYDLFGLRPMLLLAISFVANLSILNMHAELIRVHPRSGQSSRDQYLRVAVPSKTSLRTRYPAPAGGHLRGALGPSTRALTSIYVEYIPPRSIPYRQKSPWWSFRPSMSASALPLTIFWSVEVRGLHLVHRYLGPFTHNIWLCRGSHHNPRLHSLVCWSCHPEGSTTNKTNHNYVLSLCYSEPRASTARPPPTADCRLLLQEQGRPGRAHARDNPTMLLSQTMHVAGLYKTDLIRRPGPQISAGSPPPPPLICPINSHVCPSYPRVSAAAFHGQCQYASPGGDKGH